MLNSKRFQGITTENGFVFDIQFFNFSYPTVYLKFEYYDGRYGLSWEISAFNPPVGFNDYIYGRMHFFDLDDLTVRNQFFCLESFLTMEMPGLPYSWIPVENGELVEVIVRELNSCKEKFDHGL